MKKIVVIEDKSNKDIKSDRRIISNRFLEWLLYMIGYALVLVTMSVMFKSFYIASEYFGFYALLAAVIIYVLNQTIKPILFYVTLPLTAISFGLFYPLINVLILYITSFILGSKFEIDSFLICFFIAILISFLNILMEGLIIKPIINRSKK